MDDECAVCGKSRYEVFKAHLRECFICGDLHCVDCCSDDVRICERCFQKNNIIIEFEGNDEKEVNESYFKSMMAQAFAKVSPFRERLKW